MTRFRQFRFWLFAGVLAVSSLRCGGDNIKPPDASAIGMVSGDEQNGTVNGPLALPLVVVVTDEAGNPVPGVTVSWAAHGGGTVSDENVKTGSGGQASVQRILGPTTGEQVTTASVSGLQGSPVTFVSTAVPGGAPGLSIVTQPPPSALSGEVFEPAKQPVVTLSDVEGNPIVGAEVTASLASGTGSLEGGVTATTNASGIAAFGDLGIRGAGQHTIEFTSGTSSETSSAITISDLPVAATIGSWGSVVSWDIVPLHMHLLPTGKVLGWGKLEPNGSSMGMPRLWDPASGPPTGATLEPLDTMLFCSGHTLMADGRLMVSGGHKADDRGIDVTNIFDPNSESWIAGLPKMAKGRWYPTVTTLADGRLVTVGGRDELGNQTTTPELWDGSKWVQLPGADINYLPYYPRDFVAPNGLVFYAGERIMSRWLDVDGTGTGNGRGKWTDGPSHIYRFNREYGSAVMYDAGEILYVGGGGDSGWPTQDARASAPTATAEKIDLNGAGTWQNAGSMSSPRRHLNATILPDGEVLVTGGVSGGGFNNIGSAVRTAEVWNPATNDWSTLAAGSVNRGYHSVSLLLPDGTVLHGASGDAQGPGGIDYPREKSHQIFSPPYLFKGVRPSITSAPGTVGTNGETFTVSTPNAAQVTDVRWIRLGSVTHAFDASQRANTLSFTRTATGVDVTAPANANLAPPGYYLLFILNRNGVPSVGKFVKVQ